MIFAKTCSRLRPSRPDGDFRTQVAKDARLKLKQAETKRRMAKPAARIALSTAEPDVATAKRAVENAERSLVTVVTTVEDDRKS